MCVLLNLRGRERIVGRGWFLVLRVEQRERTREDGCLADGEGASRESWSIVRAVVDCQSGRCRVRRNEEAYLVRHPAEHGFHLLRAHRLPIDMYGPVCDLRGAEEGDRYTGSVERWELWFGCRLLWRRGQVCRRYGRGKAYSSCADLVKGLEEKVTAYVCEAE